MKKVFYVAILLCAVMFSACQEKAKKYDVTVNVSAPVALSELSDLAVVAVNEMGEEIAGELLDNSAAFKLISGTYTFRASASNEEFNFIGTKTEMISGNATIEVAMEANVKQESGIIFKEVYYMGVPSYYFHDAFYELVNNSNETQYLDGIIITSVAGGSWGTPSPWADAEGNLPDFYPSGTHVMAFPGSGKDYPLEPGKSVVLAAKAIDHSSRELSEEDEPSPVDLSHADWDLYVEGSQTDIDNPDVPNMLFLYKCGGFEFQCSVFGASVILAKLPEGQDLYAFAADSSNIKMPEGGYSYALCIPAEYCIDAIQIPFFDESLLRYPTILPKDDAGYALYTGSDDGEWTSASYTGRSLRRKCMLVTPERVFYQDTNNSANDFITIPTPTPGVHPTVAD